MGNDAGLDDVFATPGDTPPDPPQTAGPGDEPAGSQEPAEPTAGGQRPTRGARSSASSKRRDGHRCDCNSCRAHDRGVFGPFSPAEFAQHFDVIEPSSSTPKLEPSEQLRAAEAAEDEARALFDQAHQEWSAAAAARIAERSGSKRRAAEEREERAWEVREAALERVTEAKMHARGLRARESDAASREHAAAESQEREERRQHEEQQQRLSQANGQRSLLERILGRSGNNATDGADR